MINSNIEKQTIQKSQAYKLIQRKLYTSSQTRRNLRNNNHIYGNSQELGQDVQLYQNKIKLEGKKTDQNHGKCYKKTRVSSQQYIRKKAVNIRNQQRYFDSKQRNKSLQNKINNHMMVPNYAIIGIRTVMKNKQIQQNRFIEQHKNKQLSFERPQNSFKQQHQIKSQRIYRCSQQKQQNSEAHKSYINKKNSKLDKNNLIKNQQQRKHLIHQKNLNVNMINFMDWNNISPNQIAKKSWGKYPSPNLHKFYQFCLKTIQKDKKGIALNEQFYRQQHSRYQQILAMSKSIKFEKQNEKNQVQQKFNKKFKRYEDKNQNNLFNARFSKKESFITMKNKDRIFNNDKKLEQQPVEGWNISQQLI